MVDHDRHAIGDPAQDRDELREDAPVAPHLHVPAETAHRLLEDAEDVEPDAAHIGRPVVGMEDVEAEAANPDAVPAPQIVVADARVGDADAAQPFRRALHGIEDDAVVVAVRISLHDDAALEAEPVEMAEKRFERRVGGRVAAPFCIGEAVRGTENVRVAVAGAGRHGHGDRLRIELRTGDEEGHATPAIRAASSRSSRPLSMSSRVPKASV
jgi:hypothetical protein